MGTPVLARCSASSLLRFIVAFRPAWGLSKILIDKTHRHLGSKDALDLNRVPPISTKLWCSMCNNYQNLLDSGCNNSLDPHESSGMSTRDDGCCLFE
jgi:hypothetical protein